MADQTRDIIPKTRNRGAGAYIIADGVSMFAGMLVGAESGYANHWADGASDTFLGIVLGKGDGANQLTTTLVGDTSASIPPEVRVDDSGTELVSIAVGGSPTQASVGAPVYSADSSVSSITIDATGRNHPIGWLKRFRSASDCDVRLFTPEEMLAQRIA